MTEDDDRMDDGSGTRHGCSMLEIDRDCSKSPVIGSNQAFRTASAAACLACNERRAFLCKDASLSPRCGIAHLPLTGPVQSGGLPLS